MNRAKGRNFFFCIPKPFYTITLSEQAEQANAENTQLKEDNDKLKSENTELKQKNSRLQSMLAKTLKFCDYVRESRFGRFFFRKRIKELPEPQSMEEER